MDRAVTGMSVIDLTGDNDIDIEVDLPARGGEDACPSSSLPRALLRPRRATVAAAGVQNRGASAQSKGNGRGRPKRGGRGPQTRKKGAGRQVHPKSRRDAPALDWRCEIAAGEMRRAIEATLASWRGDGHLVRLTRPDASTVDGPDGAAMAGCFVTEYVPRGAIVGIYPGVEIPCVDGGRMTGDAYLLYLQAADTHISPFDLTTGEPQPRLRGRAPHHSLALVNEPPPGMTYNCVFAETTDGRVAGVATRDIRAGEELFTYYGAEEREYSVAELDDYTAAAMDLRSEWLLDFEGRRLVPIAGCRGRVGEGEGVGEGESETGSGV